MADSMPFSREQSEFRAALMLHAENLGLHCDGWSPQDAERADLYAQAFQGIWDNQDPGLYVVELPRAVDYPLISGIPRRVTHMSHGRGRIAGSPYPFGPTAGDGSQ